MLLRRCGFLLLLTFIVTGQAAQWHVNASLRYQELALPPPGKTGFTLMSGTMTGIEFTNHISDEKGTENSIRLTGSGVALGDVDGDGWCDIYFCGLENANVLYRNLGNWKFEDITASVGVACPGQFSTGAVFADVDGDGDLDLLVNGIGKGTRLFVNDGKGRFREVTDLAGLRGQTGSMSMALADIDGNGTLDLYVANYRTNTFQDEPNIRFRISVTNNRPVITMVDDRPVTSPDLVNRFTIDPVTRSIRELGEPDLLYRNDGRGKFTVVSWTDGSFLDEDAKRLSEPPRDWGQAVMFRDMNGDGMPDLYVCNDSESIDRIWINTGSGKFKAMDRLALREICLSSMGVDFADLDRDGHDEFFVADMLFREHTRRHTQIVDRRPLGLPGQFDDRPQVPRNTLFLNRGDGTYAEIAHLAGLDASDWSWCPIFLDVDLDGFEDLLISTGLERNVRQADIKDRVDALQGKSKPTFHERLRYRKMFPRLETPNFAFRNRGDLTFEDASAAWGFNSTQVSQGMAVADLDNDGDLDVVINSMNGPALIYRNDTVAPRVAVRLKGASPNTQGIGAKIRVLGGPVPQSQQVICGGRFLSGDDPVRVFATGSATNALTIEVRWRSGRTSLVRNVIPNRLYEIDEAASEAAQELERRSPTRREANALPQSDRQPFFSDASARLNHKHHEQTFNDFARQPLLAKGLSQLGPGAAWCDIDSDGWDDLLIGSGRSGSLTAYRNNGHGGFAPVSTQAAFGQAGDDQTGIVGWTKAGKFTLLVGTANYESAKADGVAVKRYELWAGGIEEKENLPGWDSSTGPLALADIDGDGDLDLFVGGRVIPGHYPAAATSRLYRQVGDQFQLDEGSSAVPEQVGLVSAAVWSDLDGDGFPELILACEWGPLKIFRNDKGKLFPWNPAVGALNSQRSTLNQLTGWWNSVNAGDFDGDGRMDIVAGNWGRNSKFQTYAAQPLRVYYGDLNGDGAVELIEAYYDPYLNKFVPWRHWDMMSQIMPFLVERFPNHQAYCQASVQDVLGERTPDMKELSVNTLDSMVLLNRGDHFEAPPLPLEAQLSPVFGIAIGDFDGDGNEDVFLSQNFFEVDPETSRYDAGRGIWLKGNGAGKFEAIPGQESGVTVYGEGRGVALADYDGDGRVDLVATQNGAETKLYHNERGKPGLRVRLNGPQENSQGIGAALRLVYADERVGPSREIHAGAGYWSQDSAVQVLGTPAAPAKIVIRWPGGSVVTASIPAGTRDISVDTKGTVRVNR